MSPVTRSKKGIILCSGLDPLANKRTRRQHTKKVQQKVNENIQVTFVIMLPCHSVPDKDQLTAGEVAVNDKATVPSLSRLKGLKPLKHQNAFMVRDNNTNHIFCQ